MANYAATSSTPLLAMHFGSPVNRGDHDASLYKGWFIPPTTSRYRFYQTCDDHCSLKLGVTEPGSTSNLSTLLDVTAASGHRFYRGPDGQQRISDWVELTEGQYYYIEGDMKEAAGGDHFTVSVEIE